jgi:hypothetical protein
MCSFRATVTWKQDAVVLSSFLDQKESDTPVAVLAEPNEKVATVGLAGLNFTIPRLLADQKLTVSIGSAINPQGAAEFLVLLVHPVTEEKKISPDNGEPQRNGSLVKAREAELWFAKLIAIVRR